jgi:hypothetical protein
LTLTDILLFLPSSAFELEDVLKPALETVKGIINK